MLLPLATLTLVGSAKEGVTTGLDLLFWVVRFKLFFHKMIV